jgi:hypothetical protein
MDNNTKIPSGNVLPFCLDDRKKLQDDWGTAVVDNSDHGPSPEESLRVMRAFVGIKNKRLRENLIEMLEGASRGRAPAARPVRD